MTRPLPHPLPPASLLDQLTPMQWAIGGVVAGLVLARFGGPLLRRFWFRRWLPNADTGEYQRWTHTDAHGPLVDARAHDLRRGEAAVERRARLRRVLGYGLGAGIGAALIWEAYYHSARPFGFDLNLRTTTSGLFIVLLGGIFVVPGTLAYAISAAWNLLWELAYVTGLQGWRGARVLDPPAAEINMSAPVIDDPPFATGGPAGWDEISALYGDSSPRKPAPKFKD